MLIENNYSNQILKNMLTEKTGKIELDIEKKAEEARDEKLKYLAGEFTSILLKQMFNSMRSSVFKSEFIDGGFSEDVFEDMLDEEISKKGSRQQGFNNLGRILYKQLKMND